MEATNKKPHIASVEQLLASLELTPAVELPLRLEELIDLERLALLSRLKEAGLPLAQRQKVANGLATAKREGRIGSAPADVSDPPSLSRPDPHPAQPFALCARVALPTGKHIRVYAISDAHCDHPANLQWLKTRLPERSEGAFDVCLCAGDVSDNETTLTASLRVLKDRFDEVVFVAGNHEIWVKPQPIPGRQPSTTTSLDRLKEVHILCQQMGVHVAPLWIECPGEARDVLCVPLNSWYHGEWDCEADLPGEDEELVRMFQQMWSDYSLCKWPSDLRNGSRALAERFALMNEPTLSALVRHLPPPPAAGRPPPARRLDKAETYALYGETPFSTSAWTSVDADTFFTRRAADMFATAEAPGAATGAASAGKQRPYVISLSHMVPRQELIPEKRMLLQPSLHKVCGSEPLMRQIRQLMPDAHVFGHTHLNMDNTLDGVRYVQWPLGTPREQRGQTRVSSFGLMRLYDGGEGGETPQHWTHWGRHYEEYERDLTKVARPPYVSQALGAFSGRDKAVRSTWGHEQSLQHAAGATAVGKSS